MAQIRRTEIHARRVRRAKMKKLRAKFTEAKSSADKEKILAKVARVAPWLAGEKFAKGAK